MTKLVSANMGIVLIVERDGKQERYEFSIAFPNNDIEQPIDAVDALKLFLDEVFNTSIDYHGIKIVKPKRLKPSRPVTQEQFSKKIKELGYE